MATTYQEEIQNFLELVPELPVIQHKCSKDPVEVRQEVEILRKVREMFQSIAIDEIDSLFTRISTGDWGTFSSIRTMSQLWAHYSLAASPRLPSTLYFHCNFISIIWLYIASRLYNMT